jgi:hypothetical protein
MAKCKWKFEFSASESSSVVFTHAYDPGEYLLIFPNDQRIPNTKNFKFLGVTNSTSSSGTPIFNSLPIIFSACTLVPYSPYHQMVPPYKKASKSQPTALASTFNSLLAIIGPPNVIAYTDSSHDEWVPNVLMSGFSGLKRAFDES